MRLAIFSLIIALSLGCNEKRHHPDAKKVSIPSNENRRKDLIKNREVTLVDTLIGGSKTELYYIGKGDTSISALIFKVSQYSDTVQERNNGWELIEAAEGFYIISKDSTHYAGNVLKLNPEFYLFSLPVNLSGREIWAFSIINGKGRAIKTDIYAEAGAYYIRNSKTLLVPIVRGSQNGKWEAWRYRKNRFIKIASFFPGGEFIYPLTNKLKYQLLSKYK